MQQVKYRNLIVTIGALSLLGAALFLFELCHSRIYGTYRPLDFAIDECLVCGVGVSGVGVLARQADGNLAIETPNGALWLAAGLEVGACEGRSVQYLGRLTRGLLSSDYMLEDPRLIAAYDDKEYRVKEVCYSR